MNKMKKKKTNKKYHTVGTVSKSNPKIVETEAKWPRSTHIYINTNVPVLVQ